MAYKKLFPAQEESEKVFLLVRRHWFTYVIFGFLSLLFSLPAIGIVVFWLYNPDLSLLTGNIIILGGSIYFLFVLSVFLYGFVDYYLDIYIVTDRRLVDIKQNGFFNREISELYLREVQDVKAKVSGLFPTTLHFGQVIIQTAGKTENFIFDSVPHPYAISKMIMDLHELNVGRKKPNNRLSSLKEHEMNEEFLELKGYSLEDNNQMEKQKKEADKAPSKTNDSMNKYEEKPKIKKNDTPKKSTPKEEKSEEGVLEEGKQIDI